MATIAWSLATLLVQDEPLRHAIAASAIPRCSQFSPQHVSNTVWSCAALGFVDDPLMAALSAASRRLISECDPQNLSNTLWAYATFALGTEPLLKALAAASLSLITDFMPQELSNTAWSLARLGVLNFPLMDSISEAALPKMAELSVQDMTNIPWSFANLMVQDVPLIDAIASEAIANISAFSHLMSAPMILWTLWKMSLPFTAMHFFDTCSSGNMLSQPEPFGLMLMDNDWWKDAGWELDILDRLHTMFPIRSVLVGMRKLGFSPCISLNILHPGLQKIAQLVDEVETTVAAGHAEGILTACELFAQHRGQWLKVAGQEKAEILESGLQARLLQEKEAIAEFGVFVGYTAVRLGRVVAMSRKSLGVISLEVSPLHVCVARHVLDIGELAHIAEVKTGQAKDALPCIVEELGAGAAGFSFMDHRGTIFHKDFALMQRFCLIAEGMKLTADNTLNPGSPVFLWECLPQHCLGSATATTPWALTEFLADHEDWTAVRDC